jgi:hypothetical protein
MRIAFLASQVTLPGSPSRRVDFHLHDDTIRALEGPFAAQGMSLHPVAWDAPEDWSSYTAAIIGTTWDYWDREAEFLATLARIADATRLFNPLALVRWNTSKTYLRDLEAKGARLIPTLWPDAPTPSDIARAFDTLATDTLVIKRQVGAGAHGQVRLTRTDPVPSFTLPMMVQPFIPSIESEGEYSFVFLGDTLSHALIKRPRAGDYRIQPSYGGTAHAIDPSPVDLASARAILDALPERPLYARIDMVRGPDGQMLLMEAELIEPFLFVNQGPRVGALYASALHERIG